MTHKALNAVSILLLSLSLPCCRSTFVSSKSTSKQALNQDKQETVRVATPEKQEALTQEEIISDATRQGYEVRRGQYDNYEYGYTVLIPKGLVGISDPLPQPQHGFFIILSKQPEAKIWVNGSYNSLMYTSLSDAIDADLSYLEKDGTELKIMRREPTTLQNLQAMRIAVRYKSHVSSEMMVQEIVMAIRADNKLGVIYTIRLRTPEFRYDKDKEVFEDLISTWRPKPLGR